MKNKVADTFLFTLLVVSGLLALHFLPSVSIGGKTLRQVDILADLRPDMSDDAMLADSAQMILPPLPKPVFVDSCKQGVTCIEDYADSTGCGMGFFYEALEKRAELGRPVRIAYFGDSFIEADILTADLREMLQERFGGCGVGYVSLTSPISGFRPTVEHSFEGWTSHTVTDSVGFDRSCQDLSNRYFSASPGASVTLKGVRKYASLLDTCAVSAFYFRSPDSVRVSALVNGKQSSVFNLPGDSLLRTVSVKGKIGSVKWTVEDADENATFYAATMDPKEGIVLDNFSTRGSSGQQLMGVPAALLKQYNRLRTYDLIILQYGLNVASEKGVDYNYYKTPMKRVVNYFKKMFPQASMLIVGIGDREYKTNTGELRTMPGVRNLIRYQQALAAETKSAFWNMYEAMGGEGSIVKMANNKPPMANYDYTHINFRGGKHVAKMLFDALVYGQEQYERRKAYEGE